MHSSMTVLLLFCLPHSSSTGFRSEDWMVIAETWFCAQWPIFVLFFRSVFGLLCGWKIQIWPIKIFLTESVTYWFFYLLVFDRIHDSMCLNKMSRTSSRNIGPQHHSEILQCISLYTWGTFYPCVHQTHLECLLLKSLFFSFNWPKKPVPFEVTVVSDNWICWSLFLDELGTFFLKPSQTACDDGAVWHFLKVFWPRDSTVLGESLAAQSLLLTMH